MLLTACNEFLNVDPDEEMFAPLAQLLAHELTRIARARNGKFAMDSGLAVSDIPTDQLPYQIGARGVEVIGASSMTVTAGGVPYPVSRYTYTRDGTTRLMWMTGPTDTWARFFGGLQDDGTFWPPDRLSPTYASACRRWGAQAPQGAQPSSQGRAAPPRSDWPPGDDEPSLADEFALMLAIPDTLVRLTRAVPAHVPPGGQFAAGALRARLHGDGRRSPDELEHIAAHGDPRARDVIGARRIIRMARHAAKSLPDIAPAPVFHVLPATGQDMPIHTDQDVRIRTEQYLRGRQLLNATTAEGKDRQLAQQQLAGQPTAAP